MLLGLAALVAALAGCGGVATKDITHAESEGSYLVVGGLKYQVQISRQLNPSDNGDQAYLRDVPADQKRLVPGESWFGVFLFVQNDGNRPLLAAKDFEMRDTQDAVYRPVPLARSSDYAYPFEGAPVEVPGQGRLPRTDTPAFVNSSVGGLLLLFRVKIASYDNRPLELSIKSPAVPQTTATIDIDV